MRKLALAIVRLDFITIVYFFHSLESMTKSWLTNCWLSSIVFWSMNCTISVTALPSGTRAHTEKRYSASFFSPMPKKPSF